MLNTPAFSFTPSCSNTNYYHATLPFLNNPINKTCLYLENIFPGEKFLPRLKTKDKKYTTQ